MIRCKTTMVLGRKGAKVLRMKISEMITDRYKMRIPPTIYYDLLADVQELEEEQEPTTKNDLGVDCISRKFMYELGATCIATRNEDGKLIALGAIEELPPVTPQPCDDAVSRKDVHDMLENLPITVGDKWFNWLQKACNRLAELPSVTPQEPQSFKWCTSCREYDQEKHCCHRWSKVIRNTGDEMKQEYIEREVLDELRTEITTLQNRCYALTKGTMCAFCKYECEYKAETEE